ncbi:MAG: hypothetical protein ACE5HT_10840 [Gemmatimonadales bacterium]
MRWVKAGSVSLLMFAFAACNSLDDLSDLEVTNNNNPDRARALQEAGDIESVIGAAFVSWHQATQEGYPASALSTAADEGTASWGNFGAQQLSSEPRVAWPNSTSFRFARHPQDPWFRGYRTLSSIFDGLQAIDNDDGSLCAEIDCDRARAFAKVVQGMQMGFIALMFDSAFIFDETVDLETDVLTLQPYPNVMAAALSYLQDGITKSQAGSWSLPASWILGNPLSASDFAKLAHTHKARLMTQVNRTPAERAAVDWATVIADVNAGITDDFWIDGDGANNWWHSMAWYGAQSGSTTWHRADYKSIGWTDTGNDYANWLATPVGSRQEFDFQAADERIMPPGDPTGKGLDFQNQGSSRFRPDRGTYHFSRYLAWRYEDYPNTGGQAPEPHANFNQEQMLKAEGMARTGDLAGAAALVNTTRVGRGNLPAATAADANLLDEIHYEYTIEGFYTCSGCLYFSRRGWGPLAPTGPAHHFGPVEGTPLHFAPPGKELEILQKLIYTYGGVGSEGSSLAPAAVSASVRAGGIPAREIYAFDGMDMRQKLAALQQYRDTPRNVARMVRH